MSLFPVRLVAGALALVLAGGALAGCGSTAPSSGSQDLTGPTRLQPVSGPPAAGAHRVECRVTSDHGPVRLAVDLPRGFREVGACTWAHPVQIRDPHHPMNEYVDRVVLTVQRATKRHSLPAEYAATKDEASDTFQGDDSVLDFRLRRDVPALGRTHGERLSYLCFCDGQNHLSRFAQADGVFVSWSADLPIKDPTDRQLEAVLRSAGTIG